MTVKDDPRFTRALAALPASADEAFGQLSELLKDKLWRLNTLYWIVDKNGHQVRFEMNRAQRRLYDGLHHRNIILKARQQGYSTFILIDFLDDCVFMPNTTAGLIAHTLDDAKTLFATKVKFAYDHLPEQIRAAVPLVTANKTEMELGNGSAFRVGVSLRSGTYNRLHISEYGKISSRFPEKAIEIKTGAIPTVASDGIIDVESTAEGQEGEFYEMCQRAQSMQRMGEKLTPLDFKFHFSPWWETSEYVLAAPVKITAEKREYFDKLERQGIKLSPSQQAWYVKTAETQGHNMGREFPSTAEEAFSAAVEGAYYAREMADAEADGRISRYVRFQPGARVNTSWDIGINDATSIWCWQVIGSWIYLLAYYENSGEGMSHYVAWLDRKAQKEGWTWGDHWWPHDGTVREWGSGRSRVEQAGELGFKPQIVPDIGVMDGINAVRMILPRCVFHEENCDLGIKALRLYRKEWDADRGVWKDRPRHDAFSHGADAARMIAVPYADEKGDLKRPIIGMEGATMDRLWKDAAEGGGRRSWRV